MSRNRFADLTTTRLELSDGDWCEVKNGITYGEQQAITSPLFRAINVKTDEMAIDWAQHRMLRLENWLVDWSFRDKSDKPVKLSRTTLLALSPETVAEIDAALSNHIEALDTQKKELATANGSG